MKTAPHQDPAAGAELAPAMNLVERRFDSPEELALALAAAVADDLRRGIAAHGQALLAVSGGTTPARFLTRLSEQALAWERVTLTLADERWVAPDQPRSNEQVVRHALLRHEAAEARLVSLYRPAERPESVLDQIQAAIAALPFPFDAIVLGLGTDGHCASLFPGGDRLVEALDPTQSARVLPMRAPGAGEPRITLTLSALRATRALFLHFEGAAKRAAFERALHEPGAAEKYPVRVVLERSTVPVQVFWCP